MLDAPIFYSGGEWDEHAELYVLGGRFYDPFSGRWVTDGGGENGYKFSDNNPTRDRVLGVTETDDSYAFIRGLIGDENLINASDGALLAATTGVVTVGVLGGYALGSLGAAGIAAGAKLAGTGTGAYLATQAGISAVETAFETGLVGAFGGDVSLGGVATSFARNFAVNSVTGGIGGAASVAGRLGLFAGRQAIEIGADTAIDVARGQDALASLAYNTIGSIGGELAFRGVARGLSSLRRVGAPSRLTRGGDAGYAYAREVLEGGSGRAFAGHGEFRIGSGDFTVPQGTSITAPRPGIKILDRTAGFLERGDFDGLAALAKTDARVANDVLGLRTYLPGARVPNYTLKAPGGLTVYRGSYTVQDATLLGDLLTPNAGNRVFSACTECRR